MEVLRGIGALRSWRGGLEGGASLGFVPTMGALHAGHMSLVALARKHCGRSIVSIFVNPLQFGAGEDLARYPRPLERDLDMLREAGVDAVFMPDASELYAPGASTYVVEEKVSAPLCGASRPGHFRGVATIVLKLFNLVQPDLAVFGQKDAQQCAVIERMVRDLDVPVAILRGPIVREPDGLAMSSRNAYLDPAQRAIAPLIHQSLKRAEAAFLSGERDARRLGEIGRAVLAGEPAIALEYWEVRDREHLEALEAVGPRGALLAVAARLGGTRLIDNLVLEGPGFRPAR